MAGKRLPQNIEWEAKFTELIKRHHKRNIAKVVSRLMKRLDTVKNGMVARSKKYNVDCSITVEELRQMTLEQYGTPCRYSGRILKIDNMVFDHIIPVSKGGPSTKDNIQIISKFSNAIKGSLVEEHFFILLNWLETVPEELKKDISIRLAHGVR